MNMQANQEPGATMIERAARLLSMKPDPVKPDSMEPDSVKPDTSTGSTAADPSYLSNRAADKASVGEQIGTSRVVPLDMARLRAEHVITPDTIRSKTTEEMRLIKRKVLSNYSANLGKRANLVMVTSALSGEGKTFLALNLAMSIAFEQDFRVLLIDADLAKPSIAKRLGLEGHYGLTDLLQDDSARLPDLMLKTELEGLSILPAGKPHKLNTEFLASKRMSQLLQELSQRYADRIIIFDSPPVLMATEASALASLMGQVLFVVQADKTKRMLVEEALDLIKDCPNIGLIMNQTRYKWGSTEFGSQYGHYYERRGSDAASSRTVDAPA